MLRFIFNLFLFLFGLSGCTQQTNIDDYKGEWQGKLENVDDLNIDVTIELKGEETFFHLSKRGNILTHQFKFDKKINLELPHNLTFSGITNENESVITGFIGFNRNLHPITLYKAKNLYRGNINLFAYTHLKPNNIKLNIQEVNENGYTVYPMLGSFWVMDFEHTINNITFTDFKTGLKFNGQLQPSNIVFDIQFANTSIAKASFKRTSQNKTVNAISEGADLEINDGWEISKSRLKLPKLEADILNDSLVGMDGILIAKHDKIIYEKYFGSYDAKTTHTMMSGSKSISSAMIGIAIDNHIISGVEEKLYHFIPQEYQYTKDALKSKITIKDLLTMSSGLDVNNQAQEDNYQQNSESNWLKTVLEAPMVHEPGTYADYGSANPFLLGVYLSSRLDTPLEYYMHEKLFAPLGITNYIMNTDDSSVIPYFGGGLQLTPRDMLKFGQLYLNEGLWDGKQVISKYWIEESFKKHVKLQDTKAKNEYGYFWWHDTYLAKGKAITSVEARGSGGQFIFIVPELKTVVVTTANNFRNRKGNQSRDIFRNYILPALLD